MILIMMVRYYLVVGISCLSAAIMGLHFEKKRFQGPYEVKRAPTRTKMGEAPCHWQLLQGKDVDY